MSLQTSKTPAQNIADGQRRKKSPSKLHPLAEIGSLCRASLGETVDAELNLGGAERISLHYWHEAIIRFADLRPREFVLLLLEQFIISQHLAVAAMRYDGGSQRLRLSIEEEGLTALSNGYLPLAVTRDRLFTALNLMAECRMIELDTNSWKFSIKDNL